MGLFRKLGRIPKEGPSFRVETSCSIKRLLEDKELKNSVDEHIASTRTKPNEGETSKKSKERWSAPVESWNPGVRPSLPQNKQEKIEEYRRNTCSSRENFVDHQTGFGWSQRVRAFAIHQMRQIVGWAIVRYRFEWPFRKNNCPRPGKKRQLQSGHQRCCCCCRYKDFQQGFPTDRLSSLRFLLWEKIK